MIAIIAAPIVGLCYNEIISFDIKRLHLQLITKSKIRKTALVKPKVKEPEQHYHFHLLKSIPMVAMMMTTYQSLRIQRLNLTPYSSPCRVIKKSITKDIIRIPDIITIPNVPRFLMPLDNNKDDDARRTTININNDNNQYYVTPLDEKSDSSIYPTPPVQLVCIPTNFNHADTFSINGNIQTDVLNRPSIHNVGELDDAIRMMYNYRNTMVVMEIKEDF